MGKLAASFVLMRFYNRNNKRNHWRPLAYELDFKKNINNIQPMMLEDERKNFSKWSGKCQFTKMAFEVNQVIANLHLMTNGNIFASLNTLFFIDDTSIRYLYFILEL